MNLIQLTYQWLTPSIMSILIVLLLLFKYVKRIITSPVSHIPGPFYTSLSHLPIIFLDQVSKRTPWTLKLHKRYGPIVRLSPSEVSVSSPDFIREVFVSSAEGGGGYPKAPFFNIFQHFGARNAFSSIRSEDHSWRRRLIGGLYTQTSILKKETIGGRLWGLVGDFLNSIEREGVGLSGAVSTSEISEGSKADTSSKAIDLHSFCTYYATDAITSHLFPPGLSSTALQGTKAHRSFIESSNESADEVITYFKIEYEKLESLYIIARNLLRIIGGFLGFRIKANTKERKGRTRLNIHGSGKKDNLLDGDPFYGGTEIEDWGFKRFLDTKKSVEAGNESGVVAETLARTVLEGERQKASNDQIEIPIGDDRGLRMFEELDKKFYRDDGAASECMDQFLAGRDTTGDTLSYIIHLLSIPAHHTIQSTLNAEVHSLNLPKSHSEPLTQDQITAVMKAPYIDAVIKETLRIYPASTTALQRSVPAGGRTLSHYFLPENIIIGATPMATNTSPVFCSSAKLNDVDQVKDIHSWVPERWILSESDFPSSDKEKEERDKAKLTEMERRLWTFGSGGRGCIGKHLAILEMKLLLVGIYGGWKTEICDESKVEITHNDWTKRSTFRDITFFPDAKGVVRFVAL